MEEAQEDSEEMEGGVAEGGANPKTSTLQMIQEEKDTNPTRHGIRARLIGFIMTKLGSVKPPSPVHLKTKSHQKREKQAFPCQIDWK